MRQSIRGYADGVAGRPPYAEGERLAGELAGVARVIGGSEDLRRVLGDPVVPASARRAVLDDLFGTRIGPAAMKVLGFVVVADRASETVDDIGWLAARFGGGSVQEGILGRKAAEERVDGYATALLESVAGERELGEIEDELFRFHRVVAGSDELRSALSSRDVPIDARRALVTDLLEGKAAGVTTALAAYPTGVGRPRDYEDLLVFLVARVAEESHRRLAEVRSAVELDDAQCAGLASALARAVGHDVEVRVTVDPSVVAGFVASIGDTVVDASARHQLELLRERLATPGAHDTTGERR